MEEDPTGILKSSSLHESGLPPNQAQNSLGQVGSLELQRRGTSFSGDRHEPFQLERVTQAVHTPDKGVHDFYRLIEAAIQLHPIGSRASENEQAVRERRQTERHVAQHLDLRRVVRPALNQTLMPREQAGTLGTIPRYGTIRSSKYAETSEFQGSQVDDTTERPAHSSRRQSLLPQMLTQIGLEHSQKNPYSWQTVQAGAISTSPFVVTLKATRLALAHSLQSQQKPWDLLLRSWEQCQVRVRARSSIYPLQLNRRQHGGFCLTPLDGVTTGSGGSGGTTQSSTEGLDVRRAGWEGIQRLQSEFLPDHMLSGSSVREFEDGNAVLSPRAGSSSTKDTPPAGAHSSADGGDRAQTGSNGKKDHNKWPRGGFSGARGAPDAFGLSTDALRSAATGIGLPGGSRSSSQPHGDTSYQRQSTDSYFYQMSSQGRQDRPVTPGSSLPPRWRYPGAFLRESIPGHAISSYPMHLSGARMPLRGYPAGMRAMLPSGAFQVEPGAIQSQLSRPAGAASRGSRAVLQAQQYEGVPAAGALASFGTSLAPASTTMTGFDRSVSEPSGLAPPSQTVLPRKRSRDVSIARGDSDIATATRSSRSIGSPGASAASGAGAPLSAKSVASGAVPSSEAPRGAAQSRSVSPPKEGLLHWPRASTKMRWFRLVMQSTRGGPERTAERRRKRALMVRLFDDFSFAVHCSLELLRRGSGGSVEVTDHRAKASSSSSGLASQEQRAVVRLLRNYKYADMQGWDPGMSTGSWEIIAKDHPAIPGANQGRDTLAVNARRMPKGTLLFVPPDSAGRQVRGYQLYIVFRPVGSLASRPKQYRNSIQRGVSVAKLLRGGTEKRTSICAKLRSVTSPDPNGNEAVLQWVDELLQYRVI